MELSLLGNNAPILKWEKNQVVIPEETTIDEISSFLRNFAAWENISSIALADILEFAHRKDMLEELQGVFVEIDISPVEVSKALGIATVPKGLRHPSLTAEHYFVVSRLSTYDQTGWLQQSLDHKLNAMELKRSIEAGRIITKEEIAELSGRGSGIVNYHGMVNQWERWENKVGGTQAIKTWPTDVLTRWVADVEKVHSTIEAVKQELLFRQSNTKPTK